MPRLARRTDFLRQSEIRNMTLECTRMGGINLSQGVCDTPVPDPVRRAAQAAIDAGYQTYTRYDGLDELRQAIASKLRRDNGVAYDPDGEIVVTSGSSAAFFGMAMSLLDPGDEVILFEPFYGYHADTFRALGVEMRFVRLSPPSWSFEEQTLRDAIGPRTRAIVINTPSNPCGKVFTRGEIELVGRVAREHDLVIVTDEIYEYFVFDGREHTSPAALPDLRDRTVTVSGFSKTLSITGWRIGFSACPRELSGRLGFVNDLVYICAPAPLQKGVATALGQLEPEFFAGLAREYVVKRDRICGALDQAGLTPIVPQGAYYVLADLTRLGGTTSKERVMTLLETAGVAAVPGSAFYHDDAGDHLARFCFAKTDAELEEACRRLEQLNR